MPVDGPVPWERADHTGAKHDIYRRYLERWFPILVGGSNPYPSATYVEGFAGPGVYLAGEPGSPIIAFQALLDKVPDTKPVIRFVLVDDDRRCVARLRQEFVRVFPSRPRPGNTTQFKFVEGKCAEALEPALDEMGAWGQPIIAVLDSWGNAPVPTKLLRRLAQNTASEVIVTLAPQHFVRFVSMLGNAADEIFAGDRSWRDVQGMPDGPSKRRHLLTCYRSSLQSVGFRYLLDFELVDHRGESIYLIFATNHPKGIEKMKDSLWEVDPVFGVGFRDPRDGGHETLFDLVDPHLAPLERLLLRQIELQRPAAVRVEDLRGYALYETVFRPQHVIRALLPMREAGRVHTEPDGMIRRSTMVSLA